jgi:hypothetical protein
MEAERYRRRQQQGISDSGAERRAEQRDKSKRAVHLMARTSLCSIMALPGKDVAVVFDRLLLSGAWSIHPRIFLRGNLVQPELLSISSFNRIAKRAAGAPSIIV